MRAFYLLERKVRPFPSRKDERRRLTAFEIPRALFDLPCPAFVDETPAS